MRRNKIREFMEKVTSSAPGSASATAGAATSMTHHSVNSGIKVRSVSSGGNKLHATPSTVASAATINSRSGSSVARPVAVESTSTRSRDAKNVSATAAHSSSTGNEANNSINCQLQRDRNAAGEYETIYVVWQINFLEL